MSATTASDQVHHLGLKFLESCPYEMFHAAVLGLPGE